MAKENETVADIIAEKRREANYIVQVAQGKCHTRRDCAEKMKRGEMTSDQYARELVADIRREADRLEAALKREHNRNFHRFATAEEAAKAWNERRFKDLCVVCAGCTFDRGPEECAPGAVCEIGWLYAEAKEGGTNG